MKLPVSLFAAVLLLGAQAAQADDWVQAEGCTYSHGGASVYMTPDVGTPVVFRLYDCGMTFRKIYLDLTGKTWIDSKLAPRERTWLNRALERMTGMDYSKNLVEDLDAVIEKLARERGLI